jgi:alcohol dehydrogenase (NADP+)
MEKLVGPNGPARYIGVSNFSPQQMKDILAVAKIKPKVHQFELHPYLQQNDFVEWHKQNGIAIIAYAPLGPTSNYYYYVTSRGNPSPQPPRLTSNSVLVDIAKARGCTSSIQVSLAWNMKRDVAVIPKAAQTAHQVENAATIGKCNLTDDDMQKIAGISAKWSARYNNPCKRSQMSCYQGLAHPDQGN